MLSRIIDAGGWFGKSAQMVTSIENQNLFIIECFEQCHNPLVIDFLGKTLVLQIIHYRLELIRAPLKMCLLDLNKYSINKKE